MGSLLNIDFGLLWASRGCGNRVPGLVPTELNAFVKKG